ncbi:MAG: hypothetical protein PF572_01585 [Patescibacteria group bacterium]|jgi:hypothetical protein|nr:hypothetical protein [Patescibacteria group bacterium]
MKELYTPEIIGNNHEQHKEDLEKQLVQLQVLFYDKIYQKYKDECSKNNKPINKNFSDILEEQGVYFVGDLRMVEIVSSEKDLSEEELYNLVKEKHYKILDSLYNGLPEVNIDDNTTEAFKNRSDELSVLFDYLDYEKEKAKDSYPERWQEITGQTEDESGQDGNMAGSVFYESLKESYNFDESQIKKSLEKEGFSDFDNLMQIHLPTKIDSKEKLSSKAIKESLISLSEIITGKYPDTRGIIAESWLLSHPIFQRFIKMKIIGESNYNWRQLIGENGQIEQSRIKELFETSQMPYKNLIGYISAEEFIQKYPPTKKVETN